MLLLFFPPSEHGSSVASCFRFHSTCLLPPLHTCRVLVSNKRPQVPHLTHTLVLNYLQNQYKRDLEIVSTFKRNSLHHILCREARFSLSEATFVATPGDSTRLFSNRVHCTH